MKVDYHSIVSEPGTPIERTSSAAEVVKLSLYLLDDPYVGISLATVFDCLLAYCLTTQVGFRDNDNDNDNDNNGPELEVGLEPSPDQSPSSESYTTVGAKTAIGLAAWLMAALTNELKEIVQSYRWDSFSAHCNDPLNQIVVRTQEYL